MEKTAITRYQWDRTLPTGEMYHVREDDYDAFIIARDNIIALINEEALQSHPKTDDDTLNEQYKGKTLDEIPDIDESWCEVHKIKMKAREGKFGTFYSHSQGVYPNLEWCSGKGFGEK